MLGTGKETAFVFQGVLTVIQNAVQTLELPELPTFLKYIAGGRGGGGSGRVNQILAHTTTQLFISRNACNSFNY